MGLRDSDDIGGLGHQQIYDLLQERTKLTLAKNTAYAERNQCVALLTRFAKRLYFPAYLARHDPRDTTWEHDWRWIVFIELPSGQVSWHIHDSELPAFAHLKEREGSPWDGHTTEEKYERMRIVDLGKGDRAEEE